MNLDEWAQAHGKQEQPAEDREVMQALVSEADKKAQEAADVNSLKDSITQQLQDGHEPEYILYTALEAIGILTHDAEWAQAGEKALDAVYGDLSQRSFLTDNAALARKRLQEKEADYNAKLRRDLKRRMNGYKQIEKEIGEALYALDEVEGKHQPIEWDAEISEEE